MSKVYIDTSTPVGDTQSRTGTLALIALAVSAFGIGTTEFVPVGLLAAIAQDLNMGIVWAGLLISGYAAGVAVGAPILTALAGRLNRKTLLLWLMVVFIIGNSSAALSSSFPLLLISRFITAFSHGVFFSIGSTIAVQLVPEHRKASAIALMFTGLTIATVTGVPLGTFIGQTFGWRATFWGVALLGVVSMAAIAWLVPGNLRKPEPSRLSSMLPLLTHPKLLRALLITALGYGGTFVAFTYLTPILQETMGLGEGMVSLVLLAYGVAVAIGNSIGGRWANRHPARALFKMFLLQAAVLVLLSILLPHPASGLVGVFLMGLLAFMNVPGLQLYMVQLAEKYAPSAVDVASALNIAAFNIGIAAGSLIGGWVVDSIGLVHTPWVGALMVGGAIALTGYSLRQDRKETGQG
ncbi:MFS transporter [Paenibacillus aurantius]|uniref:MFS transporter n=1 Tax=Paenibacillus aurantius TaxID=2918900 RepID=A0AA96LHI2_9BACL|nr:MFS transporter [Paenibacillus aurantius]WNQ13866.1 MFS transporter [Paenibacillus aurantius]